MMPYRGKLTPPDEIPDSAGQVDAYIALRSGNNDPVLRQHLIEAIHNHDKLYITEIAGTLSIFHDPDNSKKSKQDEEQQ